MIKRKIMAVILVAAMICTMIPSSLISASGGTGNVSEGDTQEGALSIVVTAGGNIVSGTEIPYRIYDIADTDRKTVLSEGTGTTDENGQFTIAESILESALGDGSISGIEIVAVVDTDEYYEEIVSEEINLSNMSDRLLAGWNIEAAAKRIEQTLFAFETENPASVWIGDLTDGKYTNKIADITGGSGDGTISYEITGRPENNDKAVVDADGVLSGIVAGSYTIRAIKAKSDVTADGVTTHYKPAEATYTVTFERKDRTDFKFTYETVSESQPRNTAFSNPIAGSMGGSIDGSVIRYEIIEGAADVTVDDNGTVNSPHSGTVKVRASIQQTDKYNEASAEYMVTFAAIDETNAGIMMPAGTLYVGDEIELTVNKGDHDGNVEYTYEMYDENGIPVTGDSSIIDTFDDTVSGKIKIKAKRAGKVRVNAVFAATDEYKERTVYCDCIFERKDISGFEFTYSALENKPWNEPQSNIIRGSQNNVIEGNTINYEIIENTANAELGADGTVTAKQSGSVTVKAYTDRNEGYNAAEAQYTITFVTIQYNGLSCIKERVDKEYQDTKLNGAYGELIDIGNVVNISPDTGMAVTGGLTYSITGSSADRVADIDSTSGCVRVYRAGEVKIKAVRAADSKYKEAEVEYTLCISKSDISIAFEKGSINTFIYGTGENFSNPVVTDGYNQSELGNIVYSIASDTNGVIKELNGTTGEIVFNEEKTGSIVIKAEAGESNCYNGAEGTYALNVVYEQTPGGQCTVTGLYYDGKDIKTGINYDGWYMNGEITITPPAGYMISTDDKRTGVWLDELKITATASVTDGWKVYLRNKTNNGITDKIYAGGRLDAEAPTAIEYTVSAPISAVSLLHYYRNEAVVTVKAVDIHSGVGSFWVKLDESAGYVMRTEPVIYSENGLATCTFKIPAQYRGRISVFAVDRQQNRSEAKNSNGETIIVDTIAPELQVSYMGELTDRIKADKDGVITRETMTVPDDTTRYVYSGAVELQLDVKESNFDSGNVEITVTKDGAAYTAYMYDSDGWIKTADNDYHNGITFSEDGDYQCTIKYRDWSGNDMNYSSSEYDEKNGSYTYVSNIFTIDSTRPVIDVEFQNMKGTEAGASSMHIDITDRNFRPSEVSLVISATDTENNSIDIGYSELTAWNEWTQEGDRWSADVTLNHDGIYKVILNYEDIADNDADTYSIADVLVDKTAPDCSDMYISYGKAVSSWTELSDSITLKYYAYKQEMAVTLTAYDEMAHIDSMEWIYTGINGRQVKGTIKPADISYSDGGRTATGTFTVNADNDGQLRGNISFRATDKNGNVSQLRNDESSVIIIDNISPTRTVSLSEAKQITGGKVYYYDKAMTVTFNVAEANFYGDDVKVSVNDKERAVSWSQKADGTWTAVLELSGDGDYIVKMSYMDRSDNSMTDYTSGKIVIDTVNPAVNVSYTNNNVKNTISGRKYFDANRRATITIREHNFNAADVEANVTAKDIEGNGISVTDYASYLRKASSWTTDGDTHTAVIDYNTDANYTFDITYSDMAKRKAADYAGDSFTVDKTAPEDIRVSYSGSIMDTVFNNVPFGFYNKGMTVTIEARDNISGVDRMVYSYVKSAGVSRKNAELLAQAVNGAAIKRDGAKASVTFRIPRDVLQTNNQFNGNIRCDVIDRASNSSEKADGRRIVVDNIAPSVTVNYNPPVNEKNGISYYDGNIVSQITINEANFYSQDIVIAAVKDGEPYPVSAVWSDVDADTHTGTFTLTEDGDYQISISYTDKSENVMNQYTSGQLTIDTQIPAVTLTNLSKNHAYNDDVVSFTIQASDTNIDNFAPKLIAVTRDENGGYKTIEIPLGEGVVSGDRQNISYSIPNLDMDAIYSLKCTAIDMAGHVYEGMLLESGDEVSAVDFSVNRLGSTFGVEKDYAQKLINSYYTYEVSEDLVLYEINVDPVETYRVTVNGDELEEGKDYTTGQSANEGEWSRRTYTVSKELFAEEGEYTIVVESTDKTENVAYSDLNGVKLSFVVDRTAPNVTIAGVSENKRYQTDSQTVTIRPTDDGGKLRYLKAEVLDQSGRVQKNRGIELEGEELLSALEESGGVLSFEMGEGMYQQLHIICRDMSSANDGDGNIFETMCSGITISTSTFNIFWANKPLRYGVIAGASAVIAVVVTTVIIFRKRKIKNKV